MSICVHTSQRMQPLATFSCAWRCVYVLRIGLCLCMRICMPLWVCVCVYACVWMNFACNPYRLQFPTKTIASQCLIVEAEKVQQVDNRWRWLHLPKAASQISKQLYFSSSFHPLALLFMRLTFAFYFELYYPFVYILFFLSKIRNWPFVFAFS